jgi:hypothetical protein
MTAQIPTPPRLATHRRRIQIAAVIPLVGLLAACGGGATATSSAPATQASSSVPGSGVQGGAGTFPGASGLIAAASPGTLQVQSTTAQNTVVYTAATKFTRVAAGHVATGDCVTVTGTPVAGSSQALTATSARIEAKINGACPTAGASGGFPGGGSAPTGAPNGAPTGAPPGSSGARRAFASATGTVSSVTGSTILLKGVLRDGQSAAGSTTPASPAAIAVTLGAAATVTQTLVATSAAAVVGQCARANGSANSVGTISAKSITISAPGADGCNSRFGGRGNSNSNGANGTGNPGSNV